MRWVIALLAVLGIVAAALALREHYRTEASPCSINEKWDCGAVNKSPYALIGGMPFLRNVGLVQRARSIAGIPVAVVGMAGYLLLAVLALTRSWRLLLAFSLAALAFSLYLAHIEAHLLQIWCIYCVISLAIVSSITLLALITVVVQAFRPARPA